MKNKFPLFLGLLVIISISAWAQTQSLQLPVPSENASTINFVDPLNPVLTALPAHIFIKTTTQLQGDPHIETDLAVADPPIYDAYVGQHPMYGQTVVNDADGNLLFFIVDNNIYNRYGVAMIDNNNILSQTPAFLHNGDNVGSNLFPNDAVGTTITDERFLYISDPDHPSLDPEIAVFPLDGNCLTYGIVYSFFDDEDYCGASDVFYRTLTIVDDEHVFMSPVTVLTFEMQGATACYMASNREIAVSKYRAEDQRRLIFVSFYGNLHIFPVNVNTTDIEWNEVRHFIFNDNELSKSKATEMEVVETYIGNTKAYRVAYGLKHYSVTNKYPFIRIVDFDYNTCNIIGSQIDIDVTNFPSNASIPQEILINDSRIKGIEFSPDANSIFFTYYGQPGLYYINDYYVIPLCNSTVISPSFYQYSEIELGRDGCMYYLYSNDDETIGGVSKFQNPNNPNSGSFVENIFPTEINKIYHSCDYPNNTFNSNKILLFTDQIDGDDYSVFYNEMDSVCCKRHLYYSEWPSATAFSYNPLWIWEPGIMNNPFGSLSGEVMIENSVTIPSGSQVILRNFSIEFSETAKLTIEPGAILIMQNSTLSGIDKCTEYQTWPGVELKGNSSLSQLTAGAQGQINMLNSTIKNAVWGITTGEINSSTASFGYTGGIINASNSRFVNCIHSVRFLRYSNFMPSTLQPIGNLSCFKNCVFELNDLMPEDKGAINFAELRGVDNIRFYGCTFLNLRSSPDAHKPNGIESYNSQFKVTELCLSSQQPNTTCTNSQRSEFRNLYYAIYAKSTNPLRTSFVNQSDFFNNYRSILLKNQRNAVITDNTFDVGFHSASDIQFSSYGVYLENCNGYKVQGNSFISGHQNSIGCIVDNSGEFDNIVNNNIFSTLTIGVLSQGINGYSGPDPQLISNLYRLNFSGLLIKCNTFNNNIATDIAVSSGAIKTAQGYCSSHSETPAGNQFFGNGALQNIFANPMVFPFYYNHHAGSQTTPLLLPSVSTIVHTNACPALLFEYDESCRIQSQTNIAQLQELLAGSKSIIADASNIVDGGNTQQLLDLINSNLSTGQLKNELIAASPYLSDTVLVALMNRATPMPPGNLIEILIVNSPLSEVVYNKVTDLNLPHGISLQISAAQNGVSPREILEGNVIAALDTISKYENILIDYYLNDSTSNGLPGLINMFLTFADVESKKIVVEAAILNGDIEIAQSTMEQIPLNSIETQSFVDFYSLISDWSLSGQTYDSLTMTDREILAQIAATQSSVSVSAEMLLQNDDSVRYNEVIEELLLPESMYLSGTLTDNYLCGSNRIFNDTIALINTSGEIVPSVAPVITDKDGRFMFDAFELACLNRTDSFAIKTIGGFALSTTDYRTINDWLSENPNELMLAPVNKQWEEVYSHPDSVYNSAIALDLSENLYVAGYCITNAGTTETHLVRYASDGTMLWRATYSSANYSVPADVTTDASGNIYMLINTIRASAAHDIVVVKYDSLGNRIWEAVTPGSTLDEAMKIKIAQNGDAIVLSNDQNRLQIIKFNSSGNVLWSAYRTYASGTDMDVDNNGFIYVSAQTEDSQTNQGLLLLVFSQDGQMQIEKESYRFDSSVVKSGINRDINNNIILFGSSDNQSLLSKYDFTGNLVWETVIPGEKILSVLSDSTGNIYRGSVISGAYTFTKTDAASNYLWTLPVNFPSGTALENNLKLVLGQDSNLFFGSTIHNYLARNDYFVGMIDANSNLVWEEQYSLNSISADDFADLQVSKFNNVYLTGTSRFETKDNKGNDVKKILIVTVKFATCPLTANLRSMISSGSEENSVSETDYLRVFPNPSDGNVFVEYNLSNSQTGTFSVFTTTGSPVLTVNLKTGLNTISIDERLLSEGVYYYQTMVGADVFSSGKLLIIK